jgi:hypothetical protein
MQARQQAMTTSVSCDAVISLNVSGDDAGETAAAAHSGHRVKPPRSPLLSGAATAATGHH